MPKNQRLIFSSHSGLSVIPSKAFEPAANETPTNPSVNIFTKLYNFFKKIFTALKEYISALFTSTKKSEAVKSKAAIKIQSLSRGYLVRKSASKPLDLGNKLEFPSLSNAPAINPPKVPVWPNINKSEGMLKD